MDEFAERVTAVREAESWLGTPFHANAAVKGAGVDCGRFLVEVYRAAGLSVPEKLEHWPIDWAHHSQAKGEPYLTIVRKFALEVETPGPGDFALFKIGRAHSHSAIVVKWPNVIHAMCQGKVERADASKAPLSGRAVKFFSFWPE